MRIRITDHNGQTRVTEMEAFNAAQVFANLKAAQTSPSGDHMILIGDKIMDARSVRSVEEDTDPTPVEWQETVADLQQKNSSLETQYLNLNNDFTLTKESLSNTQLELNNTKLELEQTKTDLDNATIELTMAMSANV